jgi:hypothetical protein
MHDEEYRSNQQPQLTKFRDCSAPEARKQRE